MMKLILTSGDPAGVGSEITIRALSELTLPADVSLLILGDLELYRAISEKIGINLKFSEVQKMDEIKPGVNFLNVEPSGFDLSILGKPSERSGEAAYNYLKLSAELLKGDYDGVVTAPISKENMWRVGFKYPGHTEFYADSLGARDFVMMLGGKKLKVVLVTIHVPLRNVPDLITAERLEKTIKITHREFVISFGISSPRIGVAGLNPHAGEGGKLGREEIEVIAPVVEKMKKEGYNVMGPFPADTLFYRAFRGEFDVVVSMYHDQGLGPLKLVHFDDAVNVTLGLPKVRTSVDHGTAFDIAPLFRANPGSMKSAIATAIEMIRNRKKYEVHKDKGSKGT